jgi:hypothetical protein
LWWKLLDGDRIALKLQASVSSWMTNERRRKNANQSSTCRCDEMFSICFFNMTDNTMNKHTSLNISSKRFASVIYKENILWRMKNTWPLMSSSCSFDLPLFSWCCFEQ